VDRTAADGREAREEISDDLYYLGMALAQTGLLKEAWRMFEQAQAAAVIATRYLRRPFDGPELAALPNSLRELASKIMEAISSGVKESVKPNW